MGFLSHAFLAAAFSLSPFLASAAAFKPNIIFIYADDLGMGMLGCYGQEIVKTPNIDRLASQGIMFTRCYSSQYCCPARASLLMGVHDSHSHSYTQTAGSTHQGRRGRSVPPGIAEKGRIRHGTVRQAGMGIHHLARRIEKTRLGPLCRVHGPSKGPWLLSLLPLESRRTPP